MIDFIHNYILLYIWLAFTTFLNILMPVAGSAIVLPVVTFLTDPLRALAIINMVFFFSAIHRVFLFRAEIREPKNFPYLVKLFPLAVIGVTIGTFCLSIIEVKYVVIIFILMTLKYIFTTIKKLFRDNEVRSDNNGRKYSNKFEIYLIGFISGFAQAFGLGGSEIRTNYLRTQVSEISARAIGFPIGLFSFLFSGLVLIYRGNFLPTDYYFIFTFILIIIVMQSLAKKQLQKIPDFYAKIISLVLSVIALIMLVTKYLI